MPSFGINEPRRVSIVGFSLVFSYLLSFLFEGSVLYGLMELGSVDTRPLILGAIVAHFIGLFSCGFFAESPKRIGAILRLGLALSVLGTVPFLFSPSPLWIVGISISGLASGWMVAAWGHFLKSFTPKTERIRSCADVLVLSNLIMIAINLVLAKTSPLVGLYLSLLALMVGASLLLMLPLQVDQEEVMMVDPKTSGKLGKTQRVLFIFITVITINSGLMYQVVNPAFSHLQDLVSWYWAVPYIVAILVVRHYARDSGKPIILYVAMVMMMSSFIAFMLLGRGSVDYLIVDTLMLGSFGIFDLFWWSIIGEMLTYAKNPVRIFGIGLSANVLGVLLGDMVGFGIMSSGLSTAETVVISLAVTGLTLVILPFLNNQLQYLLSSHKYLKENEGSDSGDQAYIVDGSHALSPLTEREREVLAHILEGSSNKEISEKLSISENTVKTHIRNIYSKYGVSKRAELISSFIQK